MRRLFWFLVSDFWFHLRWLELLEHSGITPPKKLAALKDETDQLTAILVSLIKKAKR